MDEQNGLAREQLWRSAASGDDAASHVRGGFAFREWPEVAPKRDPLPQMRPPCIVQSLRELGLSGQNQREWFLSPAADVGEQAQFLEQLNGKTLRLVHHQDRLFTGCGSPVEQLLQFEQQVRLGRSRARGQTKFRRQQLN